MGLNWVIFEEMVENLVFYSWVWGEIIAAVAIFFSKIAVVAIDEREPVLELVEDHTVSTYNDIRMKDVEFLRSLYATSGLSIRPRTKISKIEQLKIIIEA